MNKLTTAKRVQVIAALVEGNSIRATVRMTGVAKNTVSKLLVELGNACEAYQDRTLRNLPCAKLQVDEIWAFCHSKEKNVAPEHEGILGYGDVWTFTAIDADTKLVPTWLLAERNANWATAFMYDLRSRMANPIQLTTDGHKMYLTAVTEGFADLDVDYAMLIKFYESESEGQKRYSPARCTGTEKHVIWGNPDAKHISTSYVERQNLTMRMSMRRFTRLTNGFSKKLENMEAAVALHFMYYNFARPHQTLKGKTPAMAAGVADHVWTVEEIVALLG
jgi:transposase-like protein